MQTSPLPRSPTSAFARPAVRPCGTNLVGNANIVRPISQLVDFTQLIAMRKPGATMTLCVGGTHGVSGRDNVSPTGTHTLQIILSRNKERAPHKKNIAINRIYFQCGNENPAEVFIRPLVADEKINLRFCRRAMNLTYAEARSNIYEILMPATAGDIYLEIKDKESRELFKLDAGYWARIA